MKTRLLKLLLLAALAFGVPRPAAHAANRYWNSPNTGGWGDSLNWATGVVPGSGDVVWIGPMGQVDIGLLPGQVTPFTVDTLNFMAAGSTVIGFNDTSNSGPPPAWNQLTVSTAITNLGLGSVVLRSTSVTTPLLDVYRGSLEIADNNVFLATTVNIYGGVVCAGTAVPGASISATTWNVNGGTLNVRSGGTIGGTVNATPAGSFVNAGCSIGTGTAARCARVAA